MGSIQLEHGTFSVDLTGKGDLGKFLHPDLSTVIKLKGALSTFASGPVSALPSGSIQNAFGFERLGFA